LLIVIDVEGVVKADAATLASATLITALQLRRREMIVHCSHAVARRNKIEYSCQGFGMKFVTAIPSAATSI
jgi:hypothetical protein